MTTSDHPRADRRDDDPGEHRGLGKRILDAVLGDPADQRPGDTGRPTGAAHEEGRAPSDTATRDAGYDPSQTADDARRDAGQAGYVDQREATRDAGYDASESAADARRDVGEAGVAQRPDARASAHADDGRRDVGYDDPVARAAGHEPPRDPGRDPLSYDAPHDLAAAGYEDRRPADREPGYAASAGAGVADRSGAGQDFVTGSYDPDRDRGYDAQAAGTAVGGPGPAGAGAGQDFVTGSYDPDRDRGYDARAAGTAMETDPTQGPVARNTNTGSDDSRGGAATDYDPAQDTGYVDAGRAEADRTTGRRDDDYDTGRVDAGRDDRVATEPVEQDHPHRGAGAAAGAAAAAAFGSREHDRESRFSDVDDTATVDATDTGRSTPDTRDQGQAGIADEDGESGGRERLVPADRAQDYSSRWDALKGDFVDEPRRAVAQADDLVGELLDEIQRLFADQRRDLEQGFDHDRASTEDLRLALRRYRSFFDRLLSF
jgi:hypothetical protein